MPKTKNLRNPAKNATIVNINQETLTTTTIELVFGSLCHFFAEGGSHMNKISLRVASHLGSQLIIYITPSLFIVICDCGQYSSYVEEDLTLNKSRKNSNT